MIAVTAIMKAVPGKGDELVQAMEKIAIEVRKEPGNHGYLVHQSLDAADTLLIYEQYDDEAALEAHRAHLKELGAGLKGLLAGRADVQLFDLKSAPEAS